jgi:hypothetical protein
MHDEHVTRGEFDEQVLGAPADGTDHLILQAIGEVCRKRQPQIRPSQYDLIDAGAFHRPPQLAADVFDFGEFGHRSYPYPQVNS